MLYFLFTLLKLPLTEAPLLVEVLQQQRQNIAVELCVGHGEHRPALQTLLAGFELRELEAHRLVASVQQTMTEPAAVTVTD